MEKETENINDQYLKKVVENTEKQQESGSVNDEYNYEHAGKVWHLTLPRSVMEQKRMMNIRNEYLIRGTFESEKQLLEMIAANAQCNGKPVRLEMLDYGEVEVLKLAYLDGLLFPLSQGGEKAKLTYMEATVKNL